MLEETDDVEREDGSDLELALKTDAERAALVTLIAALEGMDEDPKLSAVRFYLRDEGWLELGCIIFSQYYDTARWVADALAAEFPEETIGVSSHFISPAISQTIPREKARHFSL